MVIMSLNLVKELNNILTDCIEIEQSIKPNSLTTNELEKIQSIKKRANLVFNKLMLPELKIDENTLHLSMELYNSIQSKIINIIPNETENKTNDKNSSSKRKNVNIISKKIAEIAFPPFGEKEKRLRLENELKSLEKKKQSLEEIEQNSKHEEIIEKTALRIEEISTELEKIISYVKKGVKTRTLFEKIGGEHVHIYSEDGIQLDAMYLDAHKFRKKLKEFGGEHITYTCAVDKEHKEEFRGLAFSIDDYKNNKNHIIQTLNKLKGIANFTPESPIFGSGWVMVEDLCNNKCVLMPDFYFHTALDNKFRGGLIRCSYQGDFFIDKDHLSKNTTTTLTEINTLSTGGTVILSSGILGVYAMHKEEALYFLFKGMNVVLFNFRGYGESDGIPSGEGLKLDYEAACDFALARSHISSDRLLIKALCMSGGPAAHAASKHPKAHLFLDQTYANFHQLSQEKIYTFMNDSIGHICSQNFIHVTSKALSYFAPNWSVVDNIAKTEGKKLILYTENDKLISENHVQLMIQSLVKENQLFNLCLYSLPGEHGTNWLNVVNRPLNQTDEWKLHHKLMQSYDQLINHIDEERVSFHKSQNEIINDLETRAFQLENSDPYMSEKLSLEAEKIRENVISKTKSMLELIEEIKNIITQLTFKTEKTNEKSMSVFNFPGRSQVAIFLNRIGIADDIIPSPTHLNFAYNSKFSDLKEKSNKIINSIESITASTEKLANSNIIKSTFKNGKYIFTCIDPYATIFEIALSKDEISNLHKHLETIRDIKSLHCEIVFNDQNTSIQEKILDCENKILEIINCIKTEKKLLINKIYKKTKKLCTAAIKDQEHILANIKLILTTSIENIKTDCSIQNMKLQSTNLEKEKESILLFHSRVKNLSDDITNQNPLSIEEKNQLNEYMNQYRMQEFSTLSDELTLAIESITSIHDILCSVENLRTTTSKLKANPHSKNIASQIDYNVEINKKLVNSLYQIIKKLDKKIVDNDFKQLIYQKALEDLKNIKKDLLSIQN
jgi:hypothetical protein